MLGKKSVLELAVWITTHCCDIDGFAPARQDGGVGS
jgi:hypothetical protein